MRRILVFLLLVGGACASRDGVVEPVLDCATAGQGVSVDAFLRVPGVMLEETEDHLTMLVLVANNSDHDREVKAIRVEPGFSAQERYRLETSFREFHHVLGPGESEEFELPVRGIAGTRSGSSRDTAMQVVVSVYFAAGDTWRCKIAVPAPR